MNRLHRCTSIGVCAIALTAATMGVCAEIESEESGTEVLEKNVRLEFKAVPLEEGDQGVYIITATPDYETSIRLEGDDGHIVFEVSGEIQLLEDGRIFVRYEAHTEVGGEDGEAEFYVSSGVILEPGKALGVSRLGDKTLMITASYIDSKRRQKTGTP